MVNMSRTLLVVSMLVYAWFLWIAYCVGRGRRWAKITYIVLTVLGMLFAALDYKRLAPKLFFSTASTFSFFVQQVLYIGICWLIFLSLRKVTPDTDVVASQ